MIDRLTIEKITDAASIVDVVGDFVALKRAGANYKGLCPFHDDRTPSFVVSPAKNFCHCFACGEGGNPVTFIMKHEQLSYPDALRYLAKKYGITIHEKELTQEEQQHKSDYESMLIVNAWALEWFKRQLHETPDGKDIGLAYFRSRGFRDDIIEKFQLGYCPNSRTVSMAADALKAGYQPEFLLNNPDTKVGTGICFQKEGSDQLRDRFFGRVMFPIFSISGKVVGFGGRVLDAATKGVNIKYQNSPESIVYNKRKELYGLYQARQAIRQKDCCFLVEGYTDVMAMHQSGVENVVASSGTALTNDQIRLIHRLTDNIVVIYDGDAAGIKASQRGIDLLLAQGMNVKLLLLPDGDDPDSFARKHNAQEYQQYLEEHQVDFIKFKTNLLKEEAKGDPIATTKLVNNIVDSIAVIPNEIARAVYIRETSVTMDIKESLIASAVARKLKELQEERFKSESKSTSESESKSKSESSPLPPLIGEDGEILEEKPSAPSDGLDTLRLTITRRAEQRFRMKEQELVKVIVRHGEQIIGTLPGDDGTPHPATIVECIHTALAGDEIELRSPDFRQILQLAVDQLGTPGFQAERYFLNYPDPAVSNLAYQLSFDTEELSRIHNQSNDQDQDSPENRLAELVTHLITDYKIELLREERDNLKSRLTSPTLSTSEKLQLLTRFKEVKDLEKQLAKICGDRVIG